jgi:hypothetical protein
MKTLQTFRVRCSIGTEQLYGDIAEYLQDNDDLDLDFDAIHEKLEAEFNGFTDFMINVEVNMETKEIVGVYGDD